MDGNVKAIELQGIVRNRTKIGVEDGQAEDLINLRFVDGSWRTSGDGRKVYVMSDNANGYHYTQLYIHTNVYRHLLGVRDGKLWWFADIESDGVTFTPKSTPEELTAVTGDMWITQTGHLLTVIDEADSFEYFVFKIGEDRYKKGVYNENELQNSRELFPFGQIKFNFSCTRAGNTQHFSGDRISETNMIGHYWFDDRFKVNRKIMDKIFTAEKFHNLMIKALNETARGKNRFTRPFLVVACIKDYAGEYHYASNPVLIHPGEKTERINAVNGMQFNNFAFYVENPYYSDDDNNNILKKHGLDHQYAKEWADGDDYEENNYFNIPSCSIYAYDSYNSPSNFIEPNRIKWDLFVGMHYGDENHTADVWRDTLSPVFAAGAFISEAFSDERDNDNGRIHYSVTPVDLYLSIDNKFVNFLKENDDLFTALSLFITPEVDVYDMSVDGQKGSVHYRYASATYAFACYKPYVRKKHDVITDLMSSPFYLLREYSVNELEGLLKDPLVDLSDYKYDGLLNNITNQQMLPLEATIRTTYLPKYTYQYNGRLHISNYNTSFFHGYPLDAFYLHNHSVNVEVGNNFLGVLPNLKSFYDSYWQFSNSVGKFLLNDDSSINDAVMLKMQERNDVFAQIIVDISVGDRITKVVRYIDTNSIYEGFGNFREKLLNPLLTYPDYRAKKMLIRLFVFIDDSTIDIRERVFSLTPHSIYNLSYYISNDLLPNEIDTLDNWSEGEVYTEYIAGNSSLENKLQEELNTIETVPNGLKVSKTNNPMFFPVENTYQVGSGEILAMCSNAIAVGAGQTGSAPLYVFCSDGIYALFVDSSGEMTYTNARVIARDVLNNPRSVTPIDKGVSFTTDRGLMLIAGEQVQEIGQPAEGDVLRYSDHNSADFIKIADGAFTKVAEFPNTLCDKTDFLTYLTGAIVNYNHNERELMISNPEKDYSYILDRNGNWSRRDYSADEYIQNYPTSYRLHNGEFYKVDEEGDNDTTLEKKKEADNKFFYLSNVIKLDSIGFKQAARFALRGYFDTKREVVRTYQEFLHSDGGYSDVVFDYNKNLKPNTHYKMTIQNTLGLVGMDIKVAYGVRTDSETYLSSKYDIPNPPYYAETASFDVYTTTSEYGHTGTAFVVRIYNDGNTSSELTGILTFQEVQSNFTTEINDYLGCYIFGSYDGRKWAMLGGNEKQGKFTDIGCKIERTDVKFFRICLSGKLRGESRIDYMEISSEPSMLNGKIR